MELVHGTTFDQQADESIPPVLLCLLRSFRLFKRGQPLAVRSGGKTEALLSVLAMRHRHGLRREPLIEEIWPDSEPGLASQSLNSLVHSLNKLLGDALAGNPPIVREEGCYRLNLEAGVRVDLISFETVLRVADHHARLGECDAASAAYRRAVVLYSGDLCVDTDVHAVVERERLRAAFLTALAYLAQYAFAHHEYTAGLEYAFRLLASNPCREDAHRLVMRCYMRRGERAQALRHYRVCSEVLWAEFNAVPEAATTALFEQVRLHPDSV
jgi:DNA-binding SARP family transcriptional activator